MEAESFFYFIREYLWPLLGLCFTTGVTTGFFFGIVWLPKLIAKAENRWQSLRDRRTIKKLQACSRLALLLSGNESVKQGYERVIADRKRAIKKRNEILRTLRLLEPLREISRDELPSEFGLKEICGIKIDPYKKELALAGLAKIRALEEQVCALTAYIQKAEPVLRNFLFQLALTKHCPDGQKFSDDKSLEEIIRSMNDDVQLIETSHSEANAALTLGGKIASLEEATKAPKALPAPQ